MHAHDIVGHIQWILLFAYISCDYGKVLLFLFNTPVVLFISNIDVTLDSIIMTIHTFHIHIQNALCISDSEVVVEVDLDTNRNLTCLCIV